MKDVREVIEGARRLLGEQGRGTILFLDEVHRFNRSQQDALLPSVEEGLLVLVGATTENPFFEVNAPLLSRSTLWRLEPLSAEDLTEVVARGLRAEGASAEPDAVAALVGLADGDARAVLTTLEVALALAGHRPVTLGDVERARHSRLHHYGEDDHYDQVSAFIKSIRGSDPDAGLYWLARMLESGEDARFIARRLVILASEDIGEADPMALVVADAAARAVEFVGLPEAQLNLAQAVVHLATSPKSNRVTVALGLAQRDVRQGPRGDVPGHLRDAHYRSAASIGHGEGYVYPHDRPDAFIEQQYRPDELVGHRYYEPSDRGHEAVVSERLRGWRAGGRSLNKAGRPPSAGRGPVRTTMVRTERMQPTGEEGRRRSTRWLAGVSAVVLAPGGAWCGGAGPRAPAPPAPRSGPEVRLSGPAPSLPAGARVLGPAAAATPITGRRISLPRHPAP